MPELKILRRCFAGASIVFAFVFATMLPALLRAPLPHATPRFHAEPVGILLIAMREMILVMPPFVAIVNGIAWWTLRNNLAATRRWAIGACSSFLVMSVPFFVADLVIQPGTVGFIGVLLFALALSSIGITGIAVFSNYGALAAQDLPAGRWNSPVAAIRS
jgi:hypothetical protein